MAVRSWGLWAFLGERLSALSSTNRVVGSVGLPRSSSSGSSKSSSSKRSYSGKSSGGEDSVDGEAAVDSNNNNASTNRIEQALKEIRIQGAAPDWLPFFPGGSFWIHPDQIAAKKPEKPSGPLLDPASERQILAMVMPMGWPTSTAADDGEWTFFIIVIICPMFWMGLLLCAEVSENCHFWGFSDRFCAGHCCPKNPREFEVVYFEAWELFMIISVLFVRMNDCWISRLILQDFQSS